MVDLFDEDAAERERQYKVMRRLGWASPEVREALLGRSLVRFLSESFFLDGDELSERSFIIAATFALLAYTGENRKNPRISVSYSPKHRPTHHELGEYGGKRRFSIGAHQYSFGYSVDFLDYGGVIGGGSSGHPFWLDDLLTEAEMVMADVGLTTKHIADERLIDLRLRPLVTAPTAVAKHNQLQNMLSTFAERDPENWSFWAGWHRDLLSPTKKSVSRDQYFAEKILNLFPFGDTDNLNRSIHSFEAEHLAETAGLTEQVTFSTELDQFERSIAPAKNPPLLSDMLAHVEDALEDVLVESSNGLGETSRTVRVVRRTLSRYANDPRRVELNLTTVHSEMVRQIAVEDLPASTANIALQEAALQAAQAIRAEHQDIARNRKLLQEQAWAEMTPEQLEEVERVLPDLRAVSEESLGSILAEDVKSLTEIPVFPAPEPNPQLAAYRRDAAVSFFGTVAKMAIEWRKLSLERQVGIAGGLASILGLLVAIGSGLLG